MVKRVLIAEDSLTQGEELKWLLARHGFSPELVTNGRDALEKLSRENFDLLLSDILMPDLSGYDLCRAVKEREKEKNIPVILLTSLSDAADIMEGLACRADSFITKPYEPSYLIECVKKFTAGASRFVDGGPAVKLSMNFKGKLYVCDIDGQQLINFLLSTYEAFAQSQTQQQETLRREKDREREAARARVEQKLAQQELELVRASKLSALGELATGIAHEILNPLTVIVARSEQFRLKAHASLPANEITSYAEQIESMGRRIGKIVGALRSLSRDSAEDPFELTLVGKMVDNSLELVKEKFKHGNVELRLRQFPSSLAIECRAVEIEQVLLNIINNAHDAVEKLAEKWVAVEVKDMGEAIQIGVTDSGRGISEDVLVKLFQKFFTTK